MAGGAVVFGALGLLAVVPYVRPVMAVLAAVLAVRAGWWHWRRLQRFTLDRYPVQARRNLAGRAWVGIAYFGWILGTSLATQMATPLVQALAALAAVLGVPFGIAAGVGLGLARSRAPWRGALTRGDSHPELVVRRYVQRARRFRLTGVASALVLLGADVTWLRI